MSRTCTEIAGRVRHRLRLLGAALLLAAAPFGADAEQIVSFMPPAAQASATHYIVNGTPTTVTVADVSLFNACPDPDRVRSAKAGVPGAFASAQAARGVGQFAVAGGDSEGGGSAEASLWMFVRDPQNRATVKLSLTFKGFASSGPPDDASPVTAANFLLAIGNMKGTPSALVSDDGCTATNANSIFDWMDSAYEILGYSRHALDLYGNVEESSAINFYTYGVLTATKPLSSDPVTLTFDAAPNQGGSVILVRATAGGGGMAVIDPIITAHPDNPDVEIEIRAPDDNTGRRPLDGFTAEDLAALGIDPQPFINLGFLWTTTATSTLDVDASFTNTKYDALTDGLLTLRYLFGLTGTSLTAGALGSTATRTDPAAIKAYLDVLRPALDVDGNGTADALTDGMLILRYMFGLRGDALIVGVVDPQATRKTAADIEAYLLTLMP